MRFIGVPHEVQNGVISVEVAPQAGQRITGWTSLAVGADLRMWRRAHAAVAQLECATQNPPFAVQRGLIVHFGQVVMRGWSRNCRVWKNGRPHHG